MLICQLPEHRSGHSTNLSSMKAFVLGAAHKKYSLKQNILIIGVIQNFHGMFKGLDAGLET